MLCPCYCTVHVYAVIHFSDSVWSFWVVANLCMVFLLLHYICCRWRWSYRGSVRITLPSLTTSHFRDCSKSGPGFPTSYAMVLFCVQWFEERDGCSLILVDDNCLNFLFTRWNSFNQYNSAKFCRTIRYHWFLFF